MSAPIPRATMLDFFRANKGEKIIQFLTWHIILVWGLKLEDIASVSITPMSADIPFPRLVSRTQFRFVFQDNRTETWIVNENARGDFYVESSWSMA